TAPRSANASRTSLADGFKPRCWNARFIATWLMPGTGFLVYSKAHRSRYALVLSPAPERRFLRRVNALSVFAHIPALFLSLWFFGPATPISCVMQGKTAAMKDMTNSEADALIADMGRKAREAASVLAEA